MVHALEIPEIRASLGSFLSLKDLFVCAQVSKSWNDTFAPLLYHSFEYSQSKNPSPETLNKYADSIRKLSYSEKINVVALPNCTRLTSLALEDARNDADPFASIAKDLILKNRSTLTEFSLHHRWKPSNPIWIALSQCPNITSISIVRCTLPQGRMTEFWDACSKVEFLTLRSLLPRFGVQNSTIVTLPDALPRLRYLELETGGALSNSTQFSIALRAPNLYSLTWIPNVASAFPIQEYRQAMLNRRWPQLRDVVFPQDIMDNDIALTLDAMTSAEMLYFAWAGFSENAHRSLMARHATTIVTLDIDHCVTVTSQMSQEILAGCPALEVLRANKICGSELVRIARIDQASVINGTESNGAIVVGRDWVCLRLRVLKLFFELSDSESESTAIFEKLQQQKQLEQEHIFRQLSRLSRLEELHISGSFYIDQTKPTLKLNLKPHGAGLQHLAALRRLKIVDIQNTDQELSELELDWMISNWPKLSRLVGALHPLQVRHYDLQVYLDEQLNERITAPR